MRRRVKRFLRNATVTVLGRRTSAQRLTREIDSIGIRRGQTLLLHSSLSSLGYVVNGACAVIEAFLHQLGPDGTFVVPTHTWNMANVGGRSFSVNESPSCVGAITEHFRLHQASVRSVHPTHSVAAAGRHAASICGSHQYAATPCGVGTPYERLLNCKADILFLGCGLERNTCFHTAEAIANAPYLLEDEQQEFSIVDAEGKTHRMEFRLHRQGIRRRFDEVVDDLEKGSALLRAKIAGASCLYVHGAAMLDIVVKKLAADPDYLLKR